MGAGRRKAESEKKNISGRATTNMGRDSKDTASAGLSVIGALVKGWVPSRSDTKSTALPCGIDYHVPFLFFSKIHILIP
jgi:hypothetical protein